MKAVELLLFPTFSEGRESSGTELAAWLGAAFLGVQLAAAVRPQPENWLLPQGGLGEIREWCRPARGLPAKVGSGGRGLTL